MKKIKLSVFLDYIAPVYYLFMNIVTAIALVFIHRDKSIILFGSWYGERFAGNSRFLFQYLSLHKEEYDFKKVIWVTRNKQIFKELVDMGYEVYMMHSLKSFYYHLKAGSHALNVNTSTSHFSGVKRTGDLMGVLSLGAKHFYLNHGRGDAKGNSFSNYKSLPRMKKLLVDIYSFLTSIWFFRHLCLCPGGWDVCTFCASSQHNIILDKMRKPKTAIKYIRYIAAGYPSFCKCIAYTAHEQEVINKLEGKKVVLYVPTYRTNITSDFFNPLNSDDFRKYLSDRKLLWVEKLHPGAQDSMKAGYYDPDVSLSLDKNFDLNLFAQNIDLLITDYSSVYFSAIAYSKPIMFYTPDYESYCKYDKGITDSLIEIIKKEQASCIEELINKMSDILDNRPKLQSCYLYLQNDLDLSFDYKRICDNLFLK